MADRKGFNGLRGSGLQVPIGSQVSEELQLQRALGKKMQEIAEEIFIRAASDLVGTNPDPESWPHPENFAELARQCQIAARSYFVGIGLIQLEQPPEDPAPAAE